ncbi:MAG: hypothetical protein MI919_33290, partial [Holophagales bacterium]|nr:hypothetical protein [Holophagales bacterium]
TLTGLQGPTCQRGLAEADGDLAPDAPASTVVVATVTPTDANAANYATTAQRCGAGQGCSFFDFHRASLRVGVGGRCDQLTTTGGVAAYQDLARTFTDRVQEKYPFVAKPPVPNTDEARPDDLASLLDAYAVDSFPVSTFFALAGRCASASAGSTSAAGTSTTGTSATGSGSSSPLSVQQTFVQQVDGVNTFFAPFMETRLETPSAQPSFALGVQFRVNQDHERWANNIVEWRLASGSGTLALEPGSTAQPPIWTYPQSVQLSLRFASDGQITPLPPQGDPYARLQDLTVTWDYRNPWSILRLVEDHPTPPERLPNFQDTNPITLELEVPAVEKVDTGNEQVKEADETEVLAYMRVTFARPDDPTVDLPFPTFPITAPALPAALVSYDGTTDACTALTGSPSR